MEETHGGQLCPCAYTQAYWMHSILNDKTALLLEQIPETASSYVFLNPKTEAPYKLHEFYYLHKKILKHARLPWVAFRDLQRQCMEVGI